MYDKPFCVQKSENGEEEVYGAQHAEDQGKKLQLLGFPVVEFEASSARSGLNERNSLGPKRASCGFFVSSAGEKSLFDNCDERKEEAD